MPVRARLAVLLVATFVIAAAFFATFGRGDDRPVVPGEPFQGSIRPAGIPPSDFRLLDQDGKPATLAEYRGRPVIVTFLYTTCEDTCPLTAQQIRGALDDVGEDVPVLIFAVDPPRDTRARARAFLAEQRVAGRMRFLVGPAAGLRRQWKAYGIQRQSDDLEHSAYVVLLDRRGVQRVGFPASEVTPDALAHDLRLLLAQKG